MGKKGRGKSKATPAMDAPPGPMDRGTLAQCLNATSQIAAECNSILRDLLRGRSPQHQDLQRLASQVLMGQSMNLQELQQKMESQQATLAELLKVLKPTSRALELGSQDASYQLPGPSLSVIKGWDSFRGDGGYSGSGARRRRTQKSAHGGRQEGLSKRERYVAVEGYWRSLSAESRRASLCAPVSRVLEVATAEGGPENAREISDGLRLLKRNGSAHACYWRCPCCDLQSADAQAFLDHLGTYHEEVQYSAEDTPLLCGHCGQEVVGAYFHTGTSIDPTDVQCLRCGWDDGAATLRPPEGWTLHVPQPSGFFDKSWSEGPSSAGEVSGSESYDDRSSGTEGASDDASSGAPSLLSDSGDDDDDINCSGGSSNSRVPGNSDSRHRESHDSAALESRVQNGADGLLMALSHRIDLLARTDRPEFEIALASVVQRAQKLMHASLPGVQMGEASSFGPEGGAAATPDVRAAVAAALWRCEKEHRDHQEDVRKALTMLSMSELQDLLALMARRYSPHANHHNVPKYNEMAPYEPMCVSLLSVGANSEHGKNVNGKAASGGGAHQESSAAQPGSGLADLPDIDKDDIVTVHRWWMDHLSHKSWHDLGTEDEAYLLQWVYGNVAHGATDEFLERQRLAWGTKSADTAIMDALAEVAETWRHLAATMDRKRHVCTLRDAVAEDVDAVAVFEPSVVESLRSQAAEFFLEVSADPALAAAASGSGPMDGSWTQRALSKLQRFHQLKDEASIRYAQTLIDREIAVLELAEVMDQHECDVAERELQTVDAALSAARQDLADAEIELARTQAEGPALHRRRDLLDRVNKEVEHRERVQELQAHIAACNERIASEEAFGTGARHRREAAVQDLVEGRSELQAHLERRQALDRACHAVLAAQERDKGQELTDEYVDARIRAVWQVVAGVADSIRTLADRYASGVESKESVRLRRCMNLAKTLTSELDERIRVWVDELDKLRRRAADLACVDAGQLAEAAVLEVMRQTLEGGAAAAREAATLDLLRELELEEEAKKAAETKKAKKKEKAKEKDKQASKKQSPAASTETPVREEQPAPPALELDGEHESPVTEEDEDIEYEAALERRRLELERQEAEQFRRAQAVSLEETAARANGKMLSAGGKDPPVVIVPVKGKDEKLGGLRSPEKEKKKDEKPRVVLVHRPATQPSAVAPSASRPKHLSLEAVPPPPPPPPPPTQGEMRIVNYYGDWCCYCNKVNKLWDTCVCGQIPPCRDWVRGRCTYKDRCRFAHPPFELPDSLPRPKSPIAKPGPDAVVYTAAKGPLVHHHHEGPSSDPVTGGTAPTKPVVSTPELRPAPPAAANSGAPTGGLVAPPPPPPPPPPLKLAPWAGVRPGAPVEGPLPVHSSPRAPKASLDLSDVTPVGPPPASPVLAAPAAEPPGLSSLQSSPIVSNPNESTLFESSGFDPFGNNPLLQALGGPPTAAAPSLSHSSPVLPPPGFSGLSLGPALGVPGGSLSSSIEQSGLGTTGQLFGPGGGGYLPDLVGAGLADPRSMTPLAPASVTFQAGGGFAAPSHFGAPGGHAMVGPYDLGLGNSAAGMRNGYDMEYDEWADLKLQLPSDLGEMLGTDPLPPPTTAGPAGVYYNPGVGEGGEMPMWGGF